MILTEEEIKEIQEKPFSQNDWLWFYTRAIEQAILDKLQDKSSKDVECKEDDGCPTEKAVLQRFWRESQDKLKNAERYEWLRDKCTYEENPNHTWIVESPPEMWDEAIDSAMKANTVSIYDMEKTNVQN